MHAGTGERGDYVVVDDPHSVDQAESDKQRQSAIEWWNGSMATRLNNMNTTHESQIHPYLPIYLVLDRQISHRGSPKHVFYKISNTFYINP